MTKLLITRPEQEAAELAALLQKRGYETVIEPMLHIKPGSIHAPDKPYQAVIATSGHALPLLDAWRALPLWIVGNASQTQARELGFTHVKDGGQDATELLQRISAQLKPKDGPLLYARGTDISLDLKTELANLGFSVEERIVYEAQAATSLSASLKAQIQQIDGVLFFSERTARIFYGLMAKMNLPHMTAFCISPRVARALNDAQWKQVLSAQTPDQESLIALVEQHLPGV